MRLARPAVVGGLLCMVAATTLVLATTASAHVTVIAPGAARGGGDQEITFRVPVEKEADTVGLRLQLPIDTPIASVDVAPIAGWTHKQTTAKLAKPIVTDDGDITEAVTEIDWTAKAGQGLKPGEFGAFTIIAGQLPNTASLTFKAIQLYSDGSRVAWNQVAAPGSTVEPENPAPVLELEPAASGAGSGTSASPSSSGAAAGHSTGGASGKASTGAATTGIVLAVIALVIGAFGVGLALQGRRRRKA